MMRAVSGVGCLALAFVAFQSLALDAQEGRMPPAPSAPGPTLPHGDHGTPKGWKFAWPKGNSAKGRDVFVKLECYSCHEIKGETLPAPTEKGKVGPELSVMGPLHGVDYFAEAILNPGAVIEKGKGYEAADGSSKMPSFNDSLTVQELIDLVAFVKSLKPPAAAPTSGRGGSGGHTGH
jgi:mono/diheme cytochrome c family protein